VPQRNRIVVPRPLEEANMTTIAGTWPWQRVALLHAISLVILLAGVGGCTKVEAPKPAPEAIQWRMALSWPENFPIFYPEAARFAQLVGTMSAGRLKIQLVDSKAHKKPLGVLDLVSTGEYEMAHTASYYFADKDPAMVLFTTMPFGMTPVEQYAWYYFGGGLALMHKVYAKHGVVAFPVGNTHIQMGGWFRKDVRSVADLQGLRMRIPGHAGKVVKRVGVDSSNLPGGEIYAAFAAGKLDAAEWVGPGHDSKLGLQNVASNYYVGWHEPATELALLVSKPKYDALPADLQTIVSTAAQATALNMLSHSFHANATEWPNLLKSAKVQVRTWPSDVIDAFRRANEDVMRDMAKASPEAAEVIASQRAFFERARNWTRIADKEYLELR